MNSADRRKLEQSITLLQEVLGQKSSSSGQASEVLIPGFSEEVQVFNGIASKFEKEIKDLNAILLEAISHMQKILNFSGSCKPFSEQ